MSDSESRALVATVRYFLVGDQIEQEVEAPDGERSSQMMPDYMAAPMLSMMGIGPIGEKG